MFDPILISTTPVHLFQRGSMLVDNDMQLRIQTNDPIISFFSHLQNTYSHRYRIIPTTDWWHLVPKEHSVSRTQGWKLHLSTTLTQALSLLERVAPLLIEQNIQWKVLLTLEHLINSSSPPSPLSQLGKFITIYPESDDIAVNLAAILHKETQSFAGPVIPSDFRYAQNSQVYYRYGSFKEQYFYHPRTALISPCILAPDGQKLLDERTTIPHYPDWVNSPFPPFEQTSPSLKGLFGRELKVCGIFSQSIKGGVYVVTNGKETFILKEARFGTCPDKLGRDARDRLTNEFTLLKKIEHLRIAPQPVDLFDAENNRYLLMEHLPGQTLRKYIEYANALGEDDPQVLRSICNSLIELVKQCHEHGIVLRDLSSNNILVTHTGCYLIDLELAHLTSSEEHPFTGSTSGFVPLGTEQLGRIEDHYDLYALGAVFFHVLTGIQPYLSKEEDIQSRLPELLDSRTFLKNASLKDIATETIRLLSSRAWEKPDHAERVLAFITAKETGIPAPGIDLPFSQDELLRNAIAIADHLSSQADFTHPDQLWSLTRRRNELYHPASFYGGATGIAYYLWEIAQITGRLEYSMYACQIIDWLYTYHPFIPGESPPGLYFGYAGLAWLSILLTESLGEVRYGEQALALADQIAQVPLVKLDLTHGMAGVGLMHLELFRRTGSNAQLAYAQRLGASLVELVLSDDQGDAIWQEEGRTMWGFAHGSSGIAYFLLALYTQTHDPIHLEVLERVHKALLRAAVPTAHGQGYSWPKDTIDKNAPWTHWCHGASGVGTYLLAAAHALRDPQLERSALKAAQAIRLSSGMRSFCQCHGLAGDGEYLLQVSRTFHLPEMTETIYQIARKLYAFRLTADGVPGYVWNNAMLEPSPDYMTGYCGIYGFLLRIFYEHLPRPLFVSL